ncbi:MAG: VWA domain-containing protein [Candidatus Adiutrix sp.]|jgi:Ca-activated chloride channel family protein|nr:VWA domain-containing protein [Candidatus Adiutrix sp.]
MPHFQTLRYFVLVMLVVFMFVFSGCEQTPPEPEAPPETQAQPEAQASPEVQVPKAVPKPQVQLESLMAAARREYDSAAMGGGMMVIPIAPAQGVAPDTAQYGNYADNGVQQVSQEPLSTFGLDVDTASYANVRRFLNEGRAPHPDAVRAEEMLNYFPWNSDELVFKPLPEAGSTRADSPFEAAYELAPSPWNPNNVLLSLSLKAKEVETAEMPPANLVFLVDVSGSMNSSERLPLVKSSLRMLVDTLRSQDRISIVTYSGATGLALAATPGNEKARILAVIDNLGAGGSTAGAAGLALAYEQAEQSFIKGGINRILLCTDGDFNVGVASAEELTAMVTRQRDRGITLSALGYGTNNFNDAMMVKIADNGNGNYSYIDTLSEAKKVLGAEMSATLLTVAKDAKAQVEFNPAAVLEYRQIGYEKRLLNAEDFNNDAVDAGDVGAGKQVTVLYELTLAGGKPSVDPLRYSQPAEAPEASAGPANADELAFVKLRWKESGGESSKLAELPVRKDVLAASFDEAGPHLRFSAAVAAYAQKLRNNPNLAATSWADIAAWAEAAKGDDPGGYRAEFIKLVGLAGTVMK